ncbi:hypothetical protein PR202_gb03319 [Eleusine coracana subsp. coracana]|uniref:Ubiquitin-like protease family profile domain-containing protein n=1 Tax=Eleusine coracana subsp. coracana TaxID=191504 RepID=A0AAV5E1H2_ELECO|nr:hypothetical protein PR202_gb03319 [Eleusine coracana subsp. coracana]
MLVSTTTPRLGIASEAALLTLLLSPRVDANPGASRDGRTLLVLVATALVVGSAIGRSICARATSLNREEMPTKQAESLSPVEEESTWESDDECDKGKANVRCIRKKVYETIQKLSRHQCTELEKLGWKDFLKFCTDALECRKLLVWLMNRIDAEAMCIPLDDVQCKKAISRTVKYEELTIFYLDHLLHRNTSQKSWTLPRSAYYTKNIVRDIIKDAKNKDSEGKLFFTGLQIKKTSDTPYFVESEEEHERDDDAFGDNVGLSEGDHDAGAAGVDVGGAGTGGHTDQVQHDTRKDDNTLVHTEEVVQGDQVLNDTPLEADKIDDNCRVVSLDTSTMNPIAHLSDNVTLELETFERGVVPRKKRSEKVFVPDCDNAHHDSQKDQGDERFVNNLFNFDDAGNVPTEHSLEDVACDRQAHEITIGQAGPNIISSNLGRTMDDNIGSLDLPGMCQCVENCGSQHNPDVFSEESLDTAFDLYMTNDIAWRSIKLILIPVIDRGHYSLYAVNFEASRVDVLDTLDYDNAGTTWLYRHGESGATVITRLNALLQKKSKGALKKRNLLSFVQSILYYLLFHPSNKAEIPEDLSPVHSSHVVSSEATKGMETPSSRVRFAAMVSNQAPDSPEYYTVPCSAPDLSPRVSPPPTTAAPGLTRQGFPSPTCPDRHTPPATINSDEMATPDPQQTYTHPHDINPEIVPRVGMVFSSEEQAKLFYKRYAREAGFPMKLSRTKKSVREICCSRIGKGEYYLGDEEERQRNNTSKKSGCKAYIKLHRDRDETGAISQMRTLQLQLPFVLFIPGQNIDYAGGTSFASIEALNALYANYEGLKDDLDSAINHPLTVAEFESCWAAMLDKYSLHENVTLSSCTGGHTDQVQHDTRKDDNTLVHTEEVVQGDQVLNDTPLEADKIDDNCRVVSLDTSTMNPIAHLSDNVTLELETFERGVVPRKKRSEKILRKIKVMKRFVNNLFNFDDAGNVPTEHSLEDVACDRQAHEITIGQAGPNIISSNLGRTMDDNIGSLDLPGHAEKLFPEDPANQNNPIDHIIETFKKDHVYTDSVAVDADTNHSDPISSPSSTKKTVFANVENCGSQHNPDAVFSEESLDTAFDLYMTNDIAWRSIKLILIPVIDRGHYSLYAVNFEASRVDVLDTLDYDNAGTTWLYRHGESGATVITRLNALLQKKSKGALKKFGNFRLTKFSCPTMVRPNDCTFLTMKYAEHYTGVPGCVDDVVNPEKSAELRAEYLYYLLFHPSNKAEIPEDLSHEDSSIAAALRIVYPRTEHRLCRWHILRKHREALNALYANYEGLKDDLDSAINHPLTVAEFESC